MVDVPQIQAAAASARAILSEMRRHVLGQDDTLALLLATLLSGGHALMVGMPGLAKTKLAACIAGLLGLSMARVQCTPDLMPSDILGSEIYEEGAPEPFRFIPGPVFTHILLVDEINRASPRTQSALLQAMQEKAVTVAGKTYPLPSPFHVLATQNPLEHLGTYPLPEAQLDRFLTHIQMDYPDPKTEEAILMATTTGEEPPLTPVLTADATRSLQAMVHAMPLGQAVVQAIVTLCQATRPKSPLAPEIVRRCVTYGAGIRAGQALMLAVRARALMDGRFAPTVEDIVALAPAVLRHRIGLNHQALRDHVGPLDVIRAVVGGIRG